MEMADGTLNLRAAPSLRLPVEVTDVMAVLGVSRQDAMPVTGVLNAYLPEYWLQYRDEDAWSPVGRRVREFARLALNVRAA
jgi:hypothetical protein